MGSAKKSINTSKKSRINYAEASDEDQVSDTKSYGLDYEDNEDPNFVKKRASKDMRKQEKAAG